MTSYNSNPRILIIHSDYPFPPRGGDSLAVGNIMKALSDYRKSTIDLVCYGRESNIMQNDKYSRLFLIKKPRRVRISKMISSLLQGESYIFHRFFSDEMHSLISKLLSENEYDAVYVEHSYMALALDFSKINPSKTDLILSVSVLEFKAWERRLSRGWIPSFLKEMINVLNRRTELNLIKKFSIVLSYGHEEVQSLKDLLPSANIYHLPVPFECKDYKKVLISSVPSERLKLICLGNYAWFPNRDAIAWLMEDLIFYLQEYSEKLFIEIIGENLPPPLADRIKKFDRSFLQWLGYVENLDSVFDDRSILFVPLRIGGGTRLKILETMCRGVPVLSTQAGKEGIGCKDDAIMVFRDGASLKDHLDQILQNSTRMFEVAKNAFDYIKKEHSYENVIYKLGTILDRTNQQATESHALYDCHSNP